jgi:hypothetical protein
VEVGFPSALEPLFLMLSVLRWMAEAIGVADGGGAESKEAVVGHAGAGMPLLPLPIPRPVPSLRDVLAYLRQSSSSGKRS